MGANEIVLEYSGKNMKEAFNNAQEDAIYEYGHDPYNGTISTCTLTKNVTSAYNQAEDKQAFINDHLEKVDKWEAHGIKLGNGKYMFIGMASC